MNFEHFFTASMTAHLITAQNVLLWPVCKREDALSINCAINCILLKTDPNVQQFLKFVNS